MDSRKRDRSRAKANQRRGAEDRAGAPAEHDANAAATDQHAEQAEHTDEIAHTAPAEHTAQTAHTAADAPEAAPLFSVVIPVYNEEGIAAAATVSLREGLRELGYSFEILLAENGSVDRTREICQQLAEKYPEVKTFSVGQPNYGKALKEGILRSRGQYVVCDEIDLGDLDFYRRALERLIDGDAALVVGSKTLPGAEDTRPVFRHVATLAYNSMLRMLLHFHGTDTHGMKAFRRDALVGTVGRCVVDRDVFASEFVIRAERERHPVVEIPVRVVEKRAPSINLLKRVPNVLRNLAYLTYVLRMRD